MKPMYCELSGLFLKVIARAFYYEHEDIAYRPRGAERKICEKLVKEGFFVIKNIFKYDAPSRKWVSTNKKYYCLSSWLRKHRL